MVQSIRRLTVVSRTLLAALAASACLSLVFASSAFGLSFPANPASLGEIPDSPAGGNVCGDFTAAPRNVTFTVAGLVGPPSDVQVSLTLATVGSGGPGHPFVGDLKVLLFGPGGFPSQTIFSQTGSTTPTGCGSGTNAQGPYTFSDSAPESPTWWGSVGTNPIPSGSYRASTPGGAVGGGANTLITPAFAGLTNPNGTWTLMFLDGGQGDVGSVSAATLTVSTPERTLTVKKAGTGAGTVSGPGIDCGSDCSSVYANGTELELTATPSAGSTFSGWSGFCVNVNGNRCLTSMTADRSVTASFTKTPVVAPPPDTTIGTHPKAKSHKHKVKFTFSSATPGATFKCKLDKAAFKACTSPFKKTVGTGKHSFEVEAVNTAGTVDPTPAKFDFKVTPKHKH